MDMEPMSYLGKGMGINAGDLMGANPVGDVRAGSRDHLFLQAILQVTGVVKPATVRVRNLSPGGMMVDYQGTAALGSPVLISLKQIEDVTGKVVWRTKDQLGIAFDQEIDPLAVRMPIGGAR